MKNKDRGYGWNLGAGGCSRLSVSGGTVLVIDQVHTPDGLKDGYGEVVTRKDAADILRELRREEIEFIRLTAAGAAVS